MQFITVLKITSSLSTVLPEDRGQAGEDGFKKVYFSYYCAYSKR